MTTPHRPSVVAFDVNETLVSLEPIRARLIEAGQPPGTLELFFARTLQHCFVLANLDQWTPFREVARAALQQSTDLEPARIEHVLDGFIELAPHRDVEPAFAALAAGGTRIIALTHGGAATADSMLDRTGLRRYVERVVTGESVRAFKPDRAVYLYAADLCGVRPDQMALVAAHAWDCHGARQAGLVTGWVSRLEGTIPNIYVPADVCAATLDDVARGLLALPA